MGFLSQVFGSPAKAGGPGPAHSQFAPSVQPKSTATSGSSRRELIRLALRSTLDRYGVPAAWIGAEVLQASAHGREPGIHLRLLIRHWEPRLLSHCVALQNAVIVRVLALDPLASHWLMGVSWQFALPDESACPAMPPAGTWAAASDPGADTAAATGGTGGATAGPMGAARKPSAPDRSAPADVKSDLERLLAVRDADLKRSAEQHAGSAQGVFLSTQPMGLEGLPPKSN